MQKDNNNNNNASSIAHAHRHHRSVRARGNRMVIKKIKETKQRQMNDIVVEVWENFWKWGACELLRTMGLTAN